MPAIVVVGAQWGDEGKGKIVDVLSQNVHANIRYNGGNNAGHTVVNEYGKIALHLIPAGIFHGCICIIGNGTVIDLRSLVSEMTELEKLSVSLKNLKISPFAHLIMPWHILKDRAKNKQRKEGVLIGTTNRGIGPCYQDKMGRQQALRVCDLLCLNDFVSRMREIYDQKVRKLAHYGDIPDFETMKREYIEARERILPFIADTLKITEELITDGKTVLLESAQGSLLDIDMGTFPFVTSSNTTSLAALQMTGIAPRELKEVVFVVKAYVTRVGEGPFPTFIEDEREEKLRELGKEFGATTTRPRKCGWLDLPLLRFAAKFNHPTSIALTKVDVLGMLEKIKVCMRYFAVGEELGAVSYIHLKNQIPEYEEFDGNWGDLGGCSTMHDLPYGLQGYIELIENFVKVPVTIISTGVKREDLIRK